MRVITVKLEEDLLNELDNYAINKKLTRSDVVRMAIEEYLKAYSRTPKAMYNS
jgi:metal-responsive CopG/Arc/MetJ family transcriptional regulator